MKKYIFSPLILPGALFGIQGAYWLSVRAFGSLFESEGWLWVLAIIGYYLFIPTFVIFAAVVYPIAQCTYGKRLSHLDGVLPKLLLSLYRAVALTASFGVLFILDFGMPRFWIWVAAHIVWSFLWSFLTALFYKEKTTAPPDEDSVRLARETGNCA